jgi:hypothetical protein
LWLLVLLMLSPMVTALAGQNGNIFDLARWQNQ